MLLSLHATAAMHVLVILCVLQMSCVYDSEDSEEDGIDLKAFQTQLAFRVYYASLQSLSNLGLQGSNASAGLPHFSCSLTTPGLSLS